MSKATSIWGNLVTVRQIRKMLRLKSVWQAQRILRELKTRGLRPKMGGRSTCYDADEVLDHWNRYHLG